VLMLSCTLCTLSSGFRDRLGCWECKVDALGFRDLLIIATFLVLGDFFSNLMVTFLLALWLEESRKEMSSDLSRGELALEKSLPFLILA
jgi:hypothetical protein